MTADPLPPEPDPVAPQQPPERRYPSTIGGAFYIAILITTFAAIVVVVVDDWRVGVRILGGALVFAGALRLVLPQRDAGMLAVRHRSIDVILLVIAGGLLWWLAGSIPDQPA